MDDSDTSSATLDTRFALIELFGGIRAARVALESLNATPMKCVQVERDAFANAMSRQRWPDDEIIENVELIDRSWAENFLREPERASFTIITAGFPCKDTSFSKTGRRT